MRMMGIMVRMGALALAGLLFAAGAQAETIKVGILKVGASGPVYIAEARGYFAAEGLTAEPVTFGAGQAVAVAVVAGDVDIGVTGLTAGLYNLASGGQIRVVAGLHREARGFRMLGYFASNRAYDAGLTSLKDVAGHSVALTTIGSTTHYAVGLLAIKYGFPIASVKIMPLQSIPNSSAAVVGGQADVGMIPGTLKPAMDKAGAHLLGWVGDETPWQIGAVFVTTKTADERGDMIHRFLRVLAKGARDYHDAFTDAHEERADGPSAPAALEIIAKAIGETPQQLDQQLPYVDPKLRLDIRDVRRQIGWYHDQGMMKGEISVDKLVDKRYAQPLQ